MWGEVTLGSVTAAGIWVAALSLIGLLIRQIVPLKRQELDADAQARTAEASFRAELLSRETLLIGRVESVESALAVERSARERERVRHNAERALDRHRLNNITQCLDSMLLLIEMNPDKGPEIVGKIKQMRATQMLAEAEEKAAIRAAEIVADEAEADHDGN